MWCCDNVGGTGKQVTCFWFLSRAFGFILRLVLSTHQWTDFHTRNCLLEVVFILLPFFGGQIPQKNFVGMHR